MVNEPADQRESQEVKPLPERRRAALHPDLRLMELAERNPSPGGRELLREIIERGAHPASHELVPARDFSAALRPRSLDDSDYRTPAELSAALHRASPALRDLYERGAVVRGDTLVLPAEAHELAEERAQPFLTTLAYAQQKLTDREQVREFHELARTISGTTADARTALTVFKIYYDRLERDERGQRLGKQDTAGQQQAVTRTLAEMRELAREMAELETRESLEIEPAEEREFASSGRAHNVAVRTVDLRAEALRWPARLSQETKERLLTKTLPELDYRLEKGVPRTELFRAIDRSMTRPDAKVSQEERTEIGGFLKQYLDERLRDPETSAAHTSPEFRQAREAFAQAQTTTDVSRVADEFWRTNRERSEAQRLYQADPANRPLPAIKPLDARERNLLFYGRAPAHYTAEMRALRIHYGLSQAERAARVAQLHRGELEPSPPLKILLEELATRHTPKAVNHFRASLLNEHMQHASRENLYRLGERLPPHERAFLYELSEQRKQAWSRVPLTERPSATVVEKEAFTTSGRPFGAAPRESASFREYLAAVGQFERQLLNQEVRKQGRDASGSPVDLTITEARALLPEPTQKELSHRARQLAWETLIPAAAVDRPPNAVAERIHETIAALQERAQAAQTARDALATVPTPKPAGRVERVEENRQPRTALELYAAQTREAVYRGFELLDDQRAALAPRQGEAHNQEIERELLVSLSTAEPARSGSVATHQTWRYDTLREVLSARFRDREGPVQGTQAVEREVSQAVEFER